MYSFSFLYMNVCFIHSIHHKLWMISSAFTKWLMTYEKAGRGSLYTILMFGYQRISQHHDSISLHCQNGIRLLSYESFRRDKHIAWNYLMIHTFYRREIYWRILQNWPSMLGLTKCTCKLQYEFGVSCACHFFLIYVVSVHMI